MKIINKIAILLALALPFTACEESDNLKDLGFPVIYIPQATYTGLDNSYPIPRGDMNQLTNYACKYDPATGNLDIAVGVVRAGYLKEQKAFSVDLKVKDSETQDRLDAYADAGTPAAAIPASVYTVPSKINVEAGKNGNSVYVSVNMKELALQKSTLLAGDTYKMLVLALEIANPTEYELAEKNTSVVILLDLNSNAWDTVDSSNSLSAIRTLFPLD